MSIEDMLAKEATRALLIQAPAERFLHGALRTEHAAGGYVRPWRIGAQQLRILGSCLSWHPGLFRQMAQTTAGICLAFTTNSSEIALEVSWDPEPKGTRAVLRDVDGEDPSLWKVHDGASCEVDGRLLAPHQAGSGEELCVWRLDDEEDVHPGWHLQRLPGFGPERTVRIWLPALRGCTIRTLWGDGTTLAPAKARPLLLVLGDSIAQGFVSDEPRASWAAEVAERHGLDLLNQSIGGQVISPEFAEAVPKDVEPAEILVELGANYRYEAYPESRLRVDARAFLAALHARWPEVPALVMTPVAHLEDRYPTHPRSCFSAVPEVLRSEAARYPEMVCVDGSRLVDPVPSAFADGTDHPTASSGKRIAERLELLLHPDGRTPEELGEAAEKLLLGAPKRALPLLEASRRGCARWLFVSEGCLLAECPSGLQLCYAPDHELGANVLALMGSRTKLELHEMALADFAAEALGLAVREPFHLAVYRGKRRVKVPERFHIEPLGEAYADEVLSLYSHPDYYTPESIRRRLVSGCFLGGFEGDELVGFIGMHEEGCIGLLEVKPEFRRRGWASALEGTLVNRLLAEGLVPWAAVYPENRASLRLHRKLGFDVGPADEQCYLVAPKR